MSRVLFPFNVVMYCIAKLNSGSAALLCFASIACGGKLRIFQRFQAAAEVPANQIAWFITCMSSWLIVTRISGSTTVELDASYVSEYKELGCDCLLRDQKRMQQ